MGGIEGLLKPMRKRCEGAVVFDLGKPYIRLRDRWIIGGERNGADRQGTMVSRGKAGSRRKKGRRKFTYWFVLTRKT